MPDGPDPLQTPDACPDDGLEAGLIAAFGPPTTPGGFSHPPLQFDLGDARHPVVVTPAPDAPPPGAGRYQVLGELARGGMGVVLMARDPDLGRDLAVKVLREELCGRPAAVRRFVEEAQVGGQLQHPGCVPVHELGALPDGRPYFAMKLVRGRTLAALLAERPEPAHDLPRFLRIFEQVCQAVAYAHSRGVVHRDLKPSNVMVGAFGEVQVMDWGLAKVLARGGVADEAGADPAPRPPVGESAGVRTVRSGGAGSDTEAGVVVGTPGFMPPEQAAGATGRADERADVFGLGGILCAVLTGQPPFAGASGEELRRKARAGDLAEAYARLDGCRADGELIALARACLAADPVLRPRDAGVVTAAVAAYRDGVEGRARRAELERAAAEARAVGERQRRRWQAVVAVGALLVVGTGGALAAWLAERQAEADRAVGQALDETRGYLDRTGGARSTDELVRWGREANGSAARAVKLAEGGFASAEVRRQAAATRAAAAEALAAAERDAALVDRLLDVTAAREPQGPRADGPGRVVPDSTPEEQYAAAFREWGLDVDRAEPAAAADQLRGRPAVVRAAAAAALDEWAVVRWRAGRPRADARRPLELAAAVDDQSQRRELRALLDGDQLRAERAAGLVSAALKPWGMLVGPAPGEGRRRLRELARLPDAAAGPTPGVLLLARLLREVGEANTAEELLRAAVRARPGEPALWTELGRLLEGQRPPRWAEAVECYTAARAARPTLGVALAQALAGAGRVGEGLALLTALVRERPDRPDLHRQLAGILLQAGRPVQAEAACREALRLRPGNAFALSNLGVALEHQGRGAEAEAAFREVVRAEPGAAFGHINLAVVLVNRGCFPEAEAASREALRLDPGQPAAHLNLAEALLGEHRLPEAEKAAREAVRLQPDFPNGSRTLGWALCLQGRSAEAEESLRAALRLRPDDPRARLYLGKALLDQGRAEEAAAAAREALRLRPDNADAHLLRGCACLRQGRQAEAEAALREALRLNPHSPLAHHNLGHALLNQGRCPEAEAALREALRLNPTVPEAHYLLGQALARQGRWSGAEAALREALRLRPGYPDPLLPLGAALGSLGRPDEAEVVLREATRLRPADALAHSNLGSALCDQGRFAEGLAELRRGHELGTGQPGWSEPSAQRVRQAERLLELDGRLPAALAGAACPARERLELAVLCQHYKNLHAAAARFYADAFAAEPGLAERAGHRSAAARSAALAGCSRGADAAGLSAADRARLRRQALAWLRADLAAWQARAGDTARAEPARRALAGWETDAALAGVRDPAALAELPGAERGEWRLFWAEVADALGRAPPPRPVTPGDAATPPGAGR
jgi:serine/threonine-protein kinase